MWKFLIKLDNEKQKLYNRNLNVDIIRTIAVFAVLSVHFFLNNGFYSENIQGRDMLIATIMRSSFMICVPLFIILTGYLMCYKKLSKSYYFGIIKTLSIYVLATICILIYQGIFLKSEISINQGIFNILSFKQYSWYVEMYIGLFMLIPFLNLIYNNLSEKKHKLYLIITLLILVTIPTMTNIYDFFTMNWIDKPSISNDYQKILPFWWSGFYPLVYYFIGAYIREYKDSIKLSLRKNFFAIIICMIVFGLFSYWRSYDSNFIWGIWSSWGSVGNVINSVLVFIFFIRINTKSVNLVVRKIFKVIADLSFGIYIVSWIFDKHFYAILNANIENVGDKTPYYFIIVPVVFCCSLILSYIINVIYNVIAKIGSKISGVINF